MEIEILGLKGTLVLYGDEWSALCFSCFTPGETAPSYICLGGGLGLMASLDVTEKTDLLPLPHSCKCGEFVYIGID